ncbi:MAG: hypothetical protein JXO44_12535 [Clostridia bacterium]|nr:hypothetical protein [Clostridia bacterium]
MRKKLLCSFSVLVLLFNLLIPAYADGVLASGAPVSAPTIKILTPEVQAWEMIEFSVSNAPMTDKTWVGLFEFKDPAYGQEYYWSSGYESKIMIKNLGNTPYFDTPRNANETRYVIALIEGYGYDLTPLVVSEPILVHERFYGPNAFIPEEREAARQFETLLNRDKSNGTYDIKTQMNNDFFNPNITDDEIARYQAFLNSNTIHEYFSKNIQDAEGKWQSIGPSPEWYSYGDEYESNTEDSFDSLGVDTYESEIPVVIMSNVNDASASGNPSVKTEFTLSVPHKVTCIELRYSPVTGYMAEWISLVDSNGKTYGPWEAFLDLPYEDEAFSLCYADLQADLPAGTYHVQVTQPSKWLSNAESGNAGMAFIEGTMSVPSYDTSQTFTPPTYIYERSNSEPATGNPTTSTLMVLKQSYIMTEIELRYMPVSVVTQGSVWLVDSKDQKYGPWQGSVALPFETETFSRFKIKMNQFLPAGAYRIEADTPSKWLNNQMSDYKGMADVLGFLYEDATQPESELLTTGQFYGMTYTAEGDALPNVLVQCYQNGHLVMAMNSMERYFYAFELPVGVYDVEFSKAGYITETHRGVELHTDESVLLQPKLKKQ